MKAKKTYTATKRLPDSGQWVHCFRLESDDGRSIYTISQNKHSFQWACSCPGWVTHRKCKHLEMYDLNNAVPKELTLPANIAALFASLIASETMATPATPSTKEYVAPKVRKILYD